MLLAFRTGNYRSLRDEVELSLMVPPRVPVEGRVVRLVSQAAGDHAGTVAGLYGANASGKSNVLAAIRAMCKAVEQSHQRWPATGGVPHDPFRLDREHRSQPTLFEAEILLDGQRWQYGFRLDQEGIAAEWLYTYPHGRKRVWFERERSRDLYVGKSLGGPTATLWELTRPNSLFLSVGAANNHAALTKVARRLIDVRFVGPEAFGDHDMETRELLTNQLLYLTGLVKDHGLASQIQQLLTFADLGITHADVREAEGAVHLLFHHRAGSSSVPLEPREESRGTRAWYALLGPLVLVLDEGGTLVVDELDSSLHPQLTARLIQMFHDPNVNTSAAQLVFSTHDTSLLGTLTGDQVLYRDELWLTEKDTDGVTRLYPATDFHPRRQENLERGYLQGRYGGVPVLRSQPIADSELA
jgi:hypothetical protein